MRRSVAPVVLALALGLSAPVAHAQYPPTVGAGRVSRSELKTCQCTQFSGDGFVPGSDVTIVDEYPDHTEHVVATVTADDKGTVKYRVCFDQGSPQGTHTVVARGTEPGGGGHEDRADVTVAGDGCNGNGGGNGGGAPAAQGGGSGGSSSGGNEASPARRVLLDGTGSSVVLPSLLFGFLLVLFATAGVHLSRRRRVAAG